MFLEDIPNNNGTFLTLDEFFEIFRFKLSFLQYNCLLFLIPRNWKKTAKKETHILSNQQGQNYTLNIQGKLILLCKMFTGLCSVCNPLYSKMARKLIHTYFNHLQHF